MSLAKTADSIFAIEEFPAASDYLLTSNLSTKIITDRRQILAYRDYLVELSDRCGQKGAMDHLEYFLTSEGSLKKIPHLVLVGPSLEHSEAGWKRVLGASLVYEYRLLGCGTGVFVTDDGCGRRMLLGLRTCGCM